MTLRINPARAALLLLDYQNYNVHPDGNWARAVPGSAERAAPAVARTAEVLAAARRTEITVIYVQNAWREGHPDVNHTPWQGDAKAAGRLVLPGVGHFSNAEAAAQFNAEVRTFLRSRRREDDH